MSTTTIPTNSDDIVDSRNVIEAIEELEGTPIHTSGDVVTTMGDLTAADGIRYLPRNLWPIPEAETDLDWDDLELLVELRKLASQGESAAPDWQYGETLIRDSYFVEYAQALAEDIGAIDSKADWPLSYIDWEAAADALRMDYTAVDFDGVTYWVR